MDDRVLLTFKDTTDTDLLPCVDGVAVVDENYCRARWNLVPDTVYINGRAPHGGELLNVFIQKSAGTWNLLAGNRYTIFGIVDLAQGQLPRTLPSTPASVITGPSTIDEAASTTVVATTWSGIPPDPSVISSFNALHDIRGTKKAEYTVNHIQCVGSLECRSSTIEVFPKVKLNAPGVELTSKKTRVLQDMYSFPVVRDDVFVRPLKRTRPSTSRFKPTDEAGPSTAPEETTRDPGSPAGNNITPGLSTREDTPSPRARTLRSTVPVNYKRQLE
ncbi:hypothetical protein R1sor_025059 [Riccia sorocarpa]|uniref:Uncharacterized protein n=1 Tax=Riccia sorocarpa TaxID=122646 RepID=A0ABD3G8U9_9MARC